MNGDNNNNNNNNNNYNIYSSMNADAFNVFNQTPQNDASATQEVNPQAAQVQAPVKPVVEKPTENLITVNDYKPPKEPFSFKNLLKKKVEEEEKKIDINDISSFVVPKKSDEEIAEEKEKKKKKKDLIMLIVLIVVLSVMGYVAYKVFSNYMLPSENGVTTDTLTTNIEVPKQVIIDTYDCDKPLDIEFYKIPYSELIALETYSGYNEYVFQDDYLYKIEESFTFLYNEFPEGVENEVIKYCNSYNAVYNAYQMLCTYKNRVLTIKDTFYINKLESNTVVNNTVSYNFIYNNKTNSAKVLEDDNTCKIKQGI